MGRAAARRAAAAVVSSAHVRADLRLPTSRDPAVNSKNRDTFRRMIKLAAEHGWGEYRTAPAFMDDA